MAGPSSLLNSFQISAQRDCFAGGYLSQGGSAAETTGAEVAKLMIKVANLKLD